MAKRKKSKRTVMYSRGGKKLYAVRDKSGKFKDIQSYARSHAADLRRKSKAESAKPAKPAAKKKAKKAAAPKKKAVATKKAAAPSKSAPARKVPAKKAAAKKAPARKAPAKKPPAKKASASQAPTPRRKAAPLALPVTAEAQPGPAVPAEVAAEVLPAGE